MPRASKLLPSLGHAASGAGGTVISTLATYPLDLVNTRLKVQRQLRADGTIDDIDAYRGILDAFHTIYAREGGLSAFFVGLGPDLVKSAADSFLFFLFYTWFRARRLHARNAPYLNTLEELAVGAAAGACAKAFTTPVSNVVTRKQTASLLDAKDGNHVKAATFSEIVADIRREKGVLGLWAGYSASLVLTLNPSMTFFLQHMLKRMFVAREKWDEPGRRATFLLAALSKVAATSVTYPFQIAKARVQVSAPSEKPSRPGLQSLAGDTIFGTVFRIAKAEGITALYDGIGGELLKGFFSHGTTMMAKDIVHGLLIQSYLAMLIFLQRYPRLRARFMQRTRAAEEGFLNQYRRVLSLSQITARRLRTAIGVSTAGKDMFAI
ncbi:peroxisomal adenine nucleotide transporter 1 [Echria macrotheca]|uniref:Peroxisomal adenine nucleotide transporter 1 n=1 Tax=Echria macrotheca TaxID=438768 RepID=A0AAJ0BEZ9_9PEZI|nr:peroxisomal adenine nucleotide transporter 1 [Echria macrotheca]